MNETPPASDAEDELAQIIDNHMGRIGSFGAPLRTARAVIAAGYRKPPLEQIRQEALARDQVRADLERADGEWGEETGDGPADPLYLDHLTDWLQRTATDTNQES